MSSDDQQRDTKDKSDSGNEFFSFLFYGFFVGPVVDWILQPGRFERKKAIYYAIGFLALLASVQTGYEIYGKEPNYYAVLQVNRDASASEIKRSYLKRSVELHPDKNPSSQATEQFTRLRDAYEVLSDHHLRTKYDLFGESEVFSKQETSDTNQLIGIITFYVVWVFISYLLNLQAPAVALTWTYIALAMIMIIELNFTFSHAKLPVVLFPKTTPHEIIRLLKDIFPSFMHGCKVIAMRVYVDHQVEIKFLTTAVLQSNKQIFLLLRDIQTQIESTSRRGGNRGGSAATAPPAAGGAPVAPPALANVAPTQSTQTLARRSKTSRASATKQTEESLGAPAAEGQTMAAVAGAHQAPAPAPSGNARGATEFIPEGVPNIAPPPNFKIPGVVMMFGTYFFFKWLFG